MTKNKQDELLLTPEEIGGLRGKFVGSLTRDCESFLSIALEAQLAKAKQHYEQKRLLPEELRKKAQEIVAQIVTFYKSYAEQTFAISATELRGRMNGFATEIEGLYSKAPNKKELQV